MPNNNLFLQSPPSRINWDAYRPQPNIRESLTKPLFVAAQKVLNFPDVALGTINRAINPAVPQNAPRMISEQFGQGVEQLSGSPQLGSAAALVGAFAVPTPPLGNTGKAAQSFTRLVSKAEMKYFKARGFLPPNADGYVNVIKPGQEAAIKGVGEDKVFRVTFTPNIVEKLESSLYPNEIGSNVQDAVKGAIPKDYIASIEPIEGFKQVGAHTRESGVVPVTDYVSRTRSSRAQKTLDAFGQSDVHTPLLKRFGVQFEIGTFGERALIRKQGQSDRFPDTELTKALNKAFLAVPASTNPDSLRSGNIVLLSRGTEGLRAVYVRPNTRGALEVINAHAIPQEKIAKYFKDIGIPSQTRTGIANLEDSQFVQLAYGDNVSLAQQIKRSMKLSPLYETQ